MQNILVVEDNDDNYFLLSEHLSDFNVSISRAENGKQFYSIISNSQNFDLVLMDLMLPDTDGVELAKHLIINQISIPIVFISAYTERCEEIFDLGVEYFLSKPLMTDLFLSVIGKFIVLEARKG